MIREAAIAALEQTGHTLAASTLRQLRDGAWVVMRTTRIFLEPEWVVDRDLVAACPDPGTAELVARRLGAVAIRTVAKDQTVASAALLADVTIDEILAIRGGKGSDPLVPEDATDEQIVALRPFVFDGLDVYDVVFVPAAAPSDE